MFDCQIGDGFLVSMEERVGYYNYAVHSPLCGIAEKQLKIGLWLMRPPKTGSTT